MSPRSLGASRGLVVGLVLGVVSHAHAAALKGRVADSAGRALGSYWSPAWRVCRN